jgi:hypothetical protein
MRAGNPASFSTLPFGKDTNYISLAILCNGVRQRKKLSQLLGKTVVKPAKGQKEKTWNFLPWSLGYTLNRPSHSGTPRAVTPTCGETFTSQKVTEHFSQHAPTSHRVQ